MAAAPRLLLIGGLAMRGREYRELAERLTAFVPIFFDNPCVGDGPRLASLSIEDQALHQWACVDGVNPTRAPIALFGLSMGGMIAATMTAQRPEQVSALAVAATSPNIEPSTEAVTASLAERWINARSKEDMEAAVDIAFGKTTKANYAMIRDAYLEYRLSGQNQQSRGDFAKQLTAIRNFDGRIVYSACRKSGTPSIVIAGEEDELFPLPHSLAIQELLNTKLQSVPSSGHMIHLEAPAALAQIIGGFLAR